MPSYLQPGSLSISSFLRIINMCMVIGLMPIVGIPLPFISYGVSNLWISFASLGWFNSIAMRRFYLSLIGEVIIPRQDYPLIYKMVKTNIGCPHIAHYKRAWYGATTQVDYFRAPPQMVARGYTKYIPIIKKHGRRSLMKMVKKVASAITTSLHYCPPSVKNLLI